MPRQIVTVKVEGLRELEAALAELPTATGKNVLRRVLKKAGQPIADAGEAYAPRLSGKLAQSYAVSTKLTRRQKRDAREGKSSVEVYVGPTPHPKSIQTEFGNAHQAPEPHMRPAWDGNKDRALQIIKDELGNEIQKAAGRLAKKAARLAAKSQA
jgi:HK97 gp10 family phage protein